MSIVYLLDTNTISYALRDPKKRVTSHIAAVPRERVAMSIITAMELRFGLSKTPSARNKAVVEAVLATMPVANLPDGIAPIYGAVRAELERNGTPIGPLDTIIAAHALALGCVLITSNMKEFRRVAQLRCEDWAAGG
jgi:tRNA(fMet)-specific endonuclease VapC